MIEKIKRYFGWSNWESIGEQLDSFQLKRYEVFKSTNTNGLSRYKKIMIISATCYPDEARVIK
jgi:hypothetical protein